MPNKARSGVGLPTAAALGVDSAPPWTPRLVATEGPTEPAFIDQFEFEIPAHARPWRVRIGLADGLIPPPGWRVLKHALQGNRLIVMRATEAPCGPATPPTARRSVP